MDKTKTNSGELAARITRGASKQTYYTFRFLADRELVPDAFRAYAYFRWVDDILDGDTGSRPVRLAFLERQQSLLEACYRGEAVCGLSAEEQILADLVANDKEKNSGLQSYLRNMMAVMEFDVKRRGRRITQAELFEYTQMLAVAVTEAMHYFIGRNCHAPRGEGRYLAVRGAHVVHMLRDTVEDTKTGYFNVPDEVIKAQGLCLEDVEAPAYREWVFDRVNLAESYFERGREHIARVKSFRCRLAGYAYIARFEYMLEVIKRDGCRLRAAYPERKSLQAGLWMAWRTLTSAFGLPKLNVKPRGLAVQLVRYDE